MENKSIGELVKEYNKLENEAFSLLKELFYRMKKSGAGYRRVVFKGGGLFSNCWNFEDRLDYNLVLKQFDRGIEKVEGLNE